MSQNPNILAQLSGVYQYYSTGKRRFTALENIDLQVYDGEYLSLLGPSGCGKSTLLRIITGLQKPSEGKVLYHGEELEGVNPYVAIVFQTFALFPWLTVFQNVDLALKTREISVERRKELALDLLDRVGLDGFETAFPRELSGGMRQKVGFARAMAVEPELLCLDEPFSALDVLSAESLRGELLELWTGGKIPTRAILMVSHNIEEAVFMADRLVIMGKDPGSIVAELPIPLRHPRQRKTPEFQAYVDQVYGILAGQTLTEAEEMGTAPGQPGRTRRLPDVRIIDLAGLLEYLEEIPGNHTDIYRLEEELSVDSETILNLTETAELLGFGSITRGDIYLTSLGSQFALADILERKELFASRIRRIPIFQWLLEVLESAYRQRLDWKVLQKALELEFPPEDTEQQLDIIIDWGRYAELLAYDSDRKLLYLEGTASEN
jgi:NitT/TauT family transport system ATP-binding protein